MTCIVGCLDKISGKVVIGGDSAGVNGNDLTIQKNPKVFKNGDFIIGCTTSFRMIQLLRFSFKPPEIKCLDLYEYMCTDFINSVRDCFDKGGFLKTETDGNEIGGNFLVGYENRLFQVYGDFNVIETINEFTSCGCGSDFALGSLFTTENLKFTTKERILKALETAETFSTGVSGPFITLET